MRSPYTRTWKSSTTLIDTNYPLGLLSNAATFNGNTPLHYLGIEHSERSFTILSQLLRSVRPELSVHNSRFSTPIEYFIQVGDVQAAHLLLSAGARPYPMNSCIQSAAQINIQESDRRGRERIEKRNELVILLLNYALDFGFLTRDVKEGHPIAGRWYLFFFTASMRPALLQRLLDEGFKPSLLTPGHVLLTALMQFLTGLKGLDSDRARSCLESIRLLVRAGERWDQRGTTNFIYTTPLEYIVKHCGRVASDVRETLIACLLDTRPPEETGAEQAHLDELCQYALGHSDMHTYKALVRYAVKGSNFFRGSGGGAEAATKPTRSRPVHTPSRRSTRIQNKTT